MRDKQVKKKQVRDKIRKEIQRKKVKHIQK